MMYDFMMSHPYLFSIVVTSSIFGAVNLISKIVAIICKTIIYIKEIEFEESERDEKR